MATMQDVQAQAYRLATNKKLPVNPASAIYRKWQALKAEGIYIGVPIGPEQPLEDGTAAQVFTSGVVLHWVGGDDVQLE